MWHYKDVISVVLCFITVFVACSVPNIKVVLAVSLICSTLAVYLSFFYKG
jgi:hypothetical protein